MSEERLKLAVFVDFDNIEIGVKTTLSRRFDVGTVLEAIKERGEVVTKVAYGNWRMAEDYSRAMTEHAFQMVQRNATPGGDKNGADINLALDALEMAFTRDHINAFVIVGGDSDFIALVEKLKQYDKKVIIVGGRAFTSAILQKNCHEFIAYENLIGLQPPSRKVSGKPMGRAQLETALPLIRRALQVLADREVSPQLGLLKSTLLQLDSTFSERDYNVGTFREFIQKLANAGFVSLKQVDRSLIVEAREAEPLAPPEAPVEASPADRPFPADGAGNGVGALLRLLQDARTAPRWPMYLRTLRQYFRSLDPSFEERRLGFGGMNDLLRQAQKENLLRVDRSRHGVIRIFPGERFPQQGSEPAPAEPAGELSLPEDAGAGAPPAQAFEQVPEAAAGFPAEQEPASGAELPEAGAPEGSAPATLSVEPGAEEKPRRRRRGAAKAESSRRKPSGARRAGGSRKAKSAVSEAPPQRPLF